MNRREANSRREKRAERNQAFKQSTLGYKDLKGGRYDEAVRHFSEAIRLNPKDDISFFNRGEARAQLDQHREAIEDYTEALRLSGTLLKAYERRGDARLKIGDTAGAQEDYARASYPRSSLAKHR